LRSAALAILLTATLAQAAAGAMPAEEKATETNGDSEDTIVLTATRVPSLIRNEPLRIEAVPAEEIEENLTVQPGNLSSLLNELPSARIQSAAPALGGVGLQLRGMPTRHTYVLTDGLPLLGAEPDDFGLLQMPPLDLGRIEVIKGAASALYGGSALGGVLNIVSKTPNAEPAVLANVSSHGGRDLEGFFTGSATKDWTGTLTAGVHDQSRDDLNGDGWADIAGYRRYTLRPRIWLDEGQDHSLFLTGGLTDEFRDGGTLPGRGLPDGSPFAVALHTRRFDGGAVSHWQMDDALTLNGRFSITSTDLDRTFGMQRVASTQTTIFGEESVGGVAGGPGWAAGVAFEHDALAVPTVPGVGYTYNVPAIFAQDEFAAAAWLKLAAAVRVDSNNAYGTFLSPRLSALFNRPASPWSLRASAGGGFAAPTPFVDEIDATGLGVLLPLRGLHAERAVTESVDGKWSADGWDVNASVFNSEIHSPLETQTAAGQKIELVNAPGSRRAPGAEVLVRYVAGPLQAIGSWSYIDATQATPGGTREPAPLVPRHSAELSGILERESLGRVGLEAVYTGTQGVEDDPFRTVGRPYVEFNALAEIRFKGVSIFVNAINFTNAHQTHFDPLIRPTPGPGGNPITDVWAPLDGRTFNLGIRTGL
jgi:outer membrane receptor for ferrienterochelin and colicins